MHIQVSAVVNYDFPETPELYLLRVGRSSSSRTPASAISLVTLDGRDPEFASSIESALGVRFLEMVLE